MSSPLYNALIENKKIICSKIIDCEDLVSFGTPEEVLKFDSNFFERYGIKCKNA